MQQQPRTLESSTQRQIFDFFIPLPAHVATNSLNSAPDRSDGYTLSTNKVVWASSNLVAVAGGGRDVGEFGEEKHGGIGGNVGRGTVWLVGGVLQCHKREGIPS